MNQNIFVKQLTSQAWKEQFGVIGDMEIIKNPKTGKTFFSYNNAEGSQVLRASMRFLDAEYLDRAKKTGVMFGQTVTGDWIGFAKGDSSNVLLSGI